MRSDEQMFVIVRPIHAKLTGDDGGVTERDQ